MEPQVPARRRFRRLGCAFVLLIVGFGSGWLVYREIAPRIRFEHLKADLGAQLPEGSTWEDAEAWFASRGIDHWEPVDSNGHGNKTSLCGRIWDGTFLGGVEIRIDLFFTNGRLSKRYVVYIDSSM